METTKENEANFFGVEYESMFLCFLLSARSIDGANLKTWDQQMKCMMLC